MYKSKKNKDYDSSLSVLCWKFKELFALLIQIENDSIITKCGQINKMYKKSTVINFKLVHHFPFFEYTRFGIFFKTFGNVRSILQYNTIKSHNGFKVRHLKRTDI